MASAAAAVTAASAAAVAAASIAAAVATAAVAATLATTAVGASCGASITACCFAYPARVDVRAGAPPLRGAWAVTVHRPV